MRPGTESTIIHERDGWWLHLPFEKRTPIVGKAEDRRQAEPDLKVGTIDLNADSAAAVALGRATLPGDPHGLARAGEREAAEGAAEGRPAAEAERAADQRATLRPLTRGRRGHGRRWHRGCHGTGVGTPSAPPPPWPTRPPPTARKGTLPVSLFWPDDPARTVATP